MNVSGRENKNKFYIGFFFFVGWDCQAVMVITAGEYYSISMKEFLKNDSSLSTLNIE